ncbi:MAG: molecular chaperone HtpG [Myxococcota bacterium]|nr:molecular chaperone HtpG [Myxococcota bacterium]
MSDSKPVRRKRSGKFQAEVSQVLRLVINSLYSNKEIFLRELLSNASDALEKLRFRALTENGLMGDDERLEISISADPDAGTLTLTDSGIGMTKDELIEQLGTIAHSGSRSFLERLGETADEGDKAEIIGQFGVGFYSAFLVADSVDVISHSATSDEVWMWSSEASESWTVTPLGDEHGRGTSVVLHLKEGMDSYLNDWTLRQLVKTYSEFVQFPIMMSEPAAEEGAEPSFVRINEAQALWRRAKSDISDEDYQKFFAHLDPSAGEPLAWSHFQVEGSQQFTGLLYLPETAPTGMEFAQQQSRVKLYVKRVFIMDEVEALVPAWLRFVSGVIESDDLPLNVSRELLQDSAIVRSIKGQIEKKVLDLLSKQKTNNLEGYTKLWKGCGGVIKEGIHHSWKHREKIAALALFATTFGEELSDLDSYIERMNDDQELIYYITGESPAALAKSPHVEGLIAAGHEVLLLSDPIDEWMVDALTEFKGKKLRNASAGELKLDEDGEALRAEQNDAFSTLQERISTVLGERIGSVRVSDRLTDSAVCLVVPDGAVNAHMERLLKTHGRDVPNAKRIFEINPSHPTITNLQALAERDETPEAFGDWLELLYDQALLTEGSSIADPAAFAQRMSRLLQRATQAELS